MANEIITVNTRLAHHLKSLAKQKGLSVDEAIDQAISLYLGSYMVSSEDRFDFHSKIAEATYLK
jgi:hypothetical protein